VSRNPRFAAAKTRSPIRLLGWCLPLAVLAQSPGAGVLFSRDNVTPRARVVIVHDPEATDAFEPRPERVHLMVQRALTNLTHQPTAAAAWRSLLSTQDVVGLKVYSLPGAQSGTRPAVVAAVVEGLLEAKIPPRQIVIWDKHRADLRGAGFFELAARYGVRVAGAAEEGYDEKTFYDRELLGHLLWDDSEFGRKGEGVGRKSYASKLVSKGLTKIVNISPLLNHHGAGVAGNLFGLAAGSVDNFFRFETDNARLAEAVPEIYALPAIGDRVALNIVDALICQYEGEQRVLLHYSEPLNELRFSADPVALDVLSLQELDRQRKEAKMLSLTNNVELYQNAALLELGVNDPANIQVERLE